MPGALRVWKYWQITAAPHWVKVVAGDLSSVVTRGPHVTRSLCLPKSLSSWSFLPVQTPSALWWRGKAEGSESPRSSEIGLQVTAERKPGSKRPGEVRVPEGLFPAWTHPAKRMTSHRACPRRTRSSLRWSPRPKSLARRSIARKSLVQRSFLPRSHLRKTNPPPRRSSFPRSSFPSCWGPRGAPQRSAFPGPNCSRRARPWSSLPAEWGNTSWKKGALRRGWHALARSLKGTYMAEI
ncbi:transcription elongation factor A protein-like 1 isoform X3 [Pipistrellus kuhlii]|uniref:transcription elongation factor A protein-like 1 isoform X3 n=1 Tax=Pipistrellus kuhlii TaxID=59472 RepID=UPI00174EF822|nr:transcription elongation factor A protein-like 1 isoform X3 [Pipistrellus kuhlii]